MKLLHSPARIAAALRTAVPGLTIEAVAETGSTNADLLARLDQLHGPVFLVADQQTAGRGRAGRTWHSERGASLTFSLAWPVRVPLQALVGLPLAVGVALADVLAGHGIAVQLKWPNDLLADGSKLAGILIETAVDRQAGARLWAVIGIGINLTDNAALAARIGQPVAALPDAGAIDRDLLLADLLGHLCLTLQEFEEYGFAVFAERWNALHTHRGQPVSIIDRGQTVCEGVAVGVDAQGRLLLDTAQGRRTVVAGDVSLRAVKA
ncbi:Biotin-protein ligase [Oxalobacteraceae bacterium IMCC9480]|nr:Biotin-protein ligase [Oxalobacteraceae bacterium IMCC9480]NDP59205.1 biotin--[acetyl-CoA-carboxylase] ligase [Oxalobacteraceae bacterium]